MCAIDRGQLSGRQRERGQGERAALRLRLARVRHAPALRGRGLRVVRGSDVLPGRKHRPVPRVLRQHAGPDREPERTDCEPNAVQPAQPLHLLGRLP